MWTVEWLDEAARERRQLPPHEEVALLRAVEKLEVLGPELPFPHQSSVRGAPGLRELRPRAGRSRWRGLYSQIGRRFVLIAIAPEAEANSKGFEAAVRIALARLEVLKREAD